MEIQGPNNLNPLNRVNERKPVSSKEKAGESRVSHESDALEISPMGQFLSKLQGIPDIRVDKVREIRAQIESGKYVTEDKLRVTVDRLLKELA
mgnify:CR=1 FL=1